MSINRYWYSEKQLEITKLFGIYDCKVFVNGEYAPYTEWTTSDNGRCNWDDAILLAESDKELHVMIKGVKQ